MGKFVGWFNGLSGLAKTGVIAGAILVPATAFGMLTSTVPTQNDPQPVQGPVTQPVREEKTETAAVAIPCTKETYDDPSLAKGQTKVTQSCVDGEKTITYTVVYIDGVENERLNTGETVTKTALAERTAIGTKVDKPLCDPNYSGACVPIASDVDCASGSGNGPAYVSGPVYVTGSDVYDLDRDGDGVGCE